MEAIRFNQNSQLDKLVKIYVTKVEKESGYKLINKNITYNDFFKNRMLLVHAIREGVSFDFFNLISIPYFNFIRGIFLNCSKFWAEKKINLLILATFAASIKYSFPSQSTMMWRGRVWIDRKRSVGWKQSSKSWSESGYRFGSGQSRRLNRFPSKT